MEQILFLDVLPYIGVWTFANAFVLALLTYYFWRFGKKHPEIFQPDRKGEDQRQLLQKESLRQEYHNKSLIALSIIFVWMIGLVTIFFVFDPSTISIQEWFVLVVAICAVLLILSNMQGKSKH